MQQTPTTRGRRRPLTSTVILPALLVAALAAAGTAEAADEGTCPPSFRCSPRMMILLAQGMERSETLRVLVDTLSSHPGVGLDLKFRRPKGGARAQSDLEVTGYYAVENGDRVRRVTGVTGEVTVPYVSYGHRQIGLIAHELAHVMIRMRGGVPIPWEIEELEATEIESAVLAELELTRAAERGNG
jgi:hypothetical protein